jgi:uncharacterized protein (TIGR03067 family)
MAALVRPVMGGDLESLSGKWTVKKTNAEGQQYVQHIEIKKDKFTFRIASSDDETRLYAEGDVKIEKAGPFKVIVFQNIQAGGSKSELSPIDDTYTSIYKLDEDSWTVATNFDRDRNQKPSLDVYKKAKS